MSQLVTIQRFLHGKMPWQGGKDHSSHRLVSILRDSEKGAVLVLYGIGVIAGCLALLFIWLDDPLVAVLVSVAFGIALTIFGIRLAKVKCYDKE